MTQRTYVVTAVVCVVTLLTLGAGWFAFGQNTNTAPEELTAGMETPLVRNVNLERKVSNLADRVTALEATVKQLKDELAKIKK